MFVKFLLIQNELQIDDTDKFDEELLKRRLTLVDENLQLDGDQFEAPINGKEIDKIHISEKIEQLFSYQFSSKQFH